jgi:hypothetical protein
VNAEFEKEGATKGREKFRSRRWHFVDTRGPDTEYLLERFAEASESESWILPLRTASYHLSATILLPSAFSNLANIPAVFPQLMSLKRSSKAERDTASCGERFECPPMFHFLVHGFENGTSLRIEYSPATNRLCSSSDRDPDVGADRAVKKHDSDSTAIAGHQERGHDFSRLRRHAGQVRYFRPNLTVIVEPSFNAIV